MMPSLTGNKQAAKRARVASLKAGKAAIQTESMRYSRRQQLKDFDIILIYR
jgi:hypothetical protein